QITLTVKGTLSNRIITSDFIIALSEYNQIQIGNTVSYTIDLNNSEDINEIKEYNTYYKKVKNMLDYFGVTEDLEIDNLTVDEWNIINDYIFAADVKIISFLEEHFPPWFFYNVRFGNIVIRIFAEKDQNSGGYRLSNAFDSFKNIRLEYKNSDNESKFIEPWTLHLYMTAEDFLCSNINYSVILDSIKTMTQEGKSFSDIMKNLDGTYLPISVDSMLLQIIQAYDSEPIKNERLIQFALDFENVIATDTPNSIINKFQVIRRMRNFTNEEIATLVELRNKYSDDKVIKCSISIVLGEFELANELLNELDEEDKKKITDHPIFNLMRK
ncbi:MAG: hypothetical protein LBF22_06890, partial [Deltaproteobacteria bacterium]|nr:hypothetical protein [Deltaproteobacteria bacterium]